jgi:ribosome maturation factor RimP
MWGMLPTFFCPWTKARNRVKEDLETIVAQELIPLGYVLVEWRRGGTRSRPLLEIRIDRSDEKAVTVEDCARASRALEAALESKAVVSGEYVLQVSSPGDRLLRTPHEWRRFVGRWVNVLAPEHGGRFEMKLMEVAGEAGAEVAVLEDEKHRSRQIPLAAITEARLSFHL